MSGENDLDPTFASWLGDQPTDSGGDELTQSLDALYTAGPDPIRVSRAQETIRRAISEAQERCLYFDVMQDTPLGPIFIGVDEQGVVALKIGVTEVEFVSGLEREYQEVVTRSPGNVAYVITQLQEYFEGKRSSFTLPLNLSHLTQFQRKVLLATLDIPHGQITTYGEIAHRLGKGRLARAVGQALARNPIPILIPCHRVLGADRSLHGYSAGRGLETKDKLLHLEGAF
jgi:methylated-DNA-[protein]-cysteine S-methyltransferase